MKKVTFPRLKLLADLIGARLVSQVTKEVFNIKKIRLWSDSATVIP